MLLRHISSLVLEALSDTPVVFLHGPRQSGKSTLAEWMAGHARPARYLTFDDAGVLAAARQDPSGFLAGLTGPVVLDEVQRAPDLFLAIKADVDRRRRPGRFLLTGSANVLLIPQLSDSLAGRMEIITLWPLSQAEIEGLRENFVDAVFARTLRPFGRSPAARSALLRRLVIGGYPDVLDRPSDDRRRAWFGSYVTTILQRDVRDLANIESLTAFPRLLSLLATRAASLLNLADISRGIGIPHTTLRRYLTLLQATFLVDLLPAWFANLGKRLVKSPKLVFADTGLMAHLLGLTEHVLGPDSMALGPLLENFVVMEIRKQAGWSRSRPNLFHFRLESGQEVDLILEGAGGNLVGIEIKASHTIVDADFKGLRVLADAAGRRFRRGIVLYTGPEPVPFGPKLHALPFGVLWRAAP